MQNNRKLAGVLLLLSLIISFLCVLLPFLWLQPFQPQTTTQVKNTFVLRNAAPWITAICVLIAFTMVWILWKRARIFGRVLYTLTLAFVLLLAWVGRQDYFEWFFNPAKHPGYTAADKVNFLSDSDMVLAVALNHDRVAYPVRLLAYHHLVNDVVGGVPIVATY